TKVGHARYPDGKPAVAVTAAFEVGVDNLKAGFQVDVIDGAAQTFGNQIPGGGYKVGAFGVKLDVELADVLRRGCSANLCGCKPDLDSQSVEVHGVHIKVNAAGLFGKFDTVTRIVERKCLRLD